MSNDVLTPTQTKFHNLCIALNPVSGVVSDTAPDKETIIRELLEGYPDLKWSIHLTQNAGDAARFASEAAKNGCDLVLACGGDGTVMEVAQGLLESNVAMAILPSGTANVMSVELGYSKDIKSILETLLTSDHEMKMIDAATMDDKMMMLRAGIGYEAEISVGASRDDKKRLGRFAYWITAWRKLRGLRRTQYRITLDDETFVAYGVTCMICNSSNIGLPNLHLTKDTDISDGLLDVIVIQNMQLPYLMGIVWGIFRSLMANAQKTPLAASHWQAKKITVETNRRQMIAIDGEAYKRGKRVTAVVIPDAVKFAIPTFAASNEGNDE